MSAPCRCRGRSPRTSSSTCSATACSTSPITASGTTNPRGSTSSFPGRGYTSEIGFEIYCSDASRNAEKLWEIVLEAGKPHGLAVIGPCHIRRIEGGILAYGADMWLDTNPYEVGMG